MERNVKLLALFNFFTDFKFHSAILVLYFAKITGSYVLAMSLFSVTMVSSSIFEIPTGVYSDFIGRKKTVVLGALSATVAAIFYAIGVGYWILFIGALCEGLSRSWYSGNNDALLHDSLRDAGKKHKYDHYLGRISAMFQLALAISAVLGSIIASRSFSLVMWLSVIPQIICFFLALLLQEPVKSGTQSSNIFIHIGSSFRLLWKNKTLRLLSLMDIVSFGISESTFQFRAAFIATLWPVWAIGFAKMLSFIGGTVSYWFSGKIISKFGGLKLLLWSKIYSKFINLFSLFNQSIFSPALLSTTSVFYGATNVAINSFMQKESTDTQRATVSSLNSLFGSIFFGIFATMLGFVADKLNPAQALIFAEICSLPIVYIAWKLTKLPSETIRTV